MRYDEDPWADVEALETERRDADIEMAEMAQAGNAIHAARKRGVCCHQGTVGYSSKPCYAEQEGLKPGQMRCTDGCQRVFESDEDWYAAMDEAVGR